MTENAKTNAEMIRREALSDADEIRRSAREKAIEEARPAAETAETMFLFPEPVSISIISESFFIKMPYMNRFVKRGTAFRNCRPAGSSYHSSPAIDRTEYPMLCFEEPSHYQNHRQALHPAPAD